MKHLGVVLAGTLCIVLGNGLEGGQKTGLPLDDALIVKVATCNQAEIEYSKLAPKRSSSEQVKEFAAQLSKEHHDCSVKVAELLKTRKIGVVAGTEKETRDEVSRLNKLEGAEFDRGYLDRVIRDHKKAITLFENQIAKGTADDVTAFTKANLPALRDHLKKAESLSKTVEK